MRPHQQGAAVVMALFIVVLCTLAVSPLIWNLFATAKTIAVSAARDQAEAVSRSGLDWARVILREDARVSASDTLTEPWAVPLAESRLNEGLMRQDQNATEIEDREVILTGRIEDAQGRFNLRNLGADNPRQANWLEAFAKLCELLGVPNDQRLLIAQLIAQMHSPPTSAEGGQEQTASRLQPALRWEEFQGKYGVAEETWNQLRPYVAILPKPTGVNANTATAEVLYAAIDELSFGDAQRLLSQRERVSFRNIADVRSALNSNITVNGDMVGVASSYFLVEGSAQVEEALIRTRALLERRDQRVYVLWRQ
ncbi:type II secretion system minor pseudopilin GspK [Limnobacter sp.]|uniref:type II secretion system minor pseudopilin GspK n=1 Tax=Limnobacter sp. TaxID=2003368 RepID=UPI0035152357